MQPCALTPACSPLAESTSNLDSQPAPKPDRVLSPTRAGASPLSPHHGVKSPVTDMPPKDFSFIQDPQAYHVLPASNVPAPFLNTPNAPLVSTPLDSLLHSGHYRLAAIAASRRIITATSPTDYETLLHLVHVRLACLCLISEHALAAQESKVLGDLNSTFYKHPLTDAHIVPWDLRLLVVRLAALGYGEWRKGIMGYYELARECRENLLKCDSNDDQTLWRTRLRDCGIRVANVLVEMGELESAGRHLRTLSESSDSRELLIMETLVWLCIGDMQSARRCLSSASEIESDQALDGTLDALLQLANSDYTSATLSFQALHHNFPENSMITQNLAVCLLYTGHISEARQLLIELTDETPPFHSLVFNLSTIYELCTERNKDKKVALAEKLALRKTNGSVGWEITNADFKL
jgi:tetratricopeptide (TPR) repeat protein